MADLRAWLGVSLLVAAVGCAPGLRSPRSLSPRPHFFSSSATLDRSPLELHLASTPSAASPGLLLLYASGDGGWFGAAVGMFRELATTGCPVVGISSKAFLKIDRPSKKLVDPRQLAGEYALVIGQARVALGLPSDTPVLLTGWSRGASFAVLAAGELRRTDRVVGVLAIGLPRGEDLTIDGPDDETDDGPTDDVVKRWPFDPYQQIVRLAPVPVAIIQATHDNYLPAARAQQLFGPDTDDRRFYTVDARNHRFSGSKPGLNRSLLDAVSWIRSRFAASSTLAPPSCL